MSPDPKDILYKDLETGELYIVGYNAQKMSGNDTEDELFAQKRYNSPIFKIICNTAIALATHKFMRNTNGRRVVIQTGLPSAYLETDTFALKKALTNNTPFALKVGESAWAGGRNWHEYQFNISSDDISVMKQPQGALYSVIVRNDGDRVRSTDPDMPYAKRLLCGRTIVLDAGFGTFDFYGIQERRDVLHPSLDDIGMKAVLQKTSDLILKETGEKIPIAAMQRNLEDGWFKVVNEDEMIAEKVDIESYINRAMESVLKEAKQRIQSNTHSFRDYDYVIIDGGTGEAWYEELSNWLSRMNLTIFRSDFNDKLGMMYSNARGYYMFRLLQDKSPNR